MRDLSEHPNIPHTVYWHFFQLNRQYSIGKLFVVSSKLTAGLEYLWVVLTPLGISSELRARSRVKSEEWGVRTTWHLLLTLNLLSPSSNHLGAQMRVPGEMKKTLAVFWCSPFLQFKRMRVVSHHGARAQYWQIFVIAPRRLPNFICKLWHMYLISIESQ